MKKQSGFTLIEIVMVLVLLGILTAVAVPKYFDLQKEAAQKAAATFAAEYQARLNANFAKQLLTDTSQGCAAALKAAIGATNTDMVVTSGDGVYTAPADTQTATPFALKIKVNGTSFPDKDDDSATTKGYSIAIPQCGS